jgi:hypothetical protein
MDILKRDKIYIDPDTKITWILKRGRISVIVPRNNASDINLPNFWGACHWRDVISENSSVLYATWTLKKVKWKNFYIMHSYLASL